MIGIPVFALGVVAFILKEFGIDKQVSLVDVGWFFCAGALINWLGRKYKGEKREA